MSISTDLVQRVFTVLAGQDLPEAEAQQLAQTLQTKQELLAYLLVCRGIFTHEPDLIAALKDKP